MGSGAGEDCERYKHNTVPEEHLTLNLWWFLTAAEQVSLFISEEIGTFSGLYFLEHIKKPLIIFILLQFEDEMPPTPISSLISTAFSVKLSLSKIFSCSWLPSPHPAKHPEQMPEWRGMRFRVRLFWALLEHLFDSMHFLLLFAGKLSFTRALTRDLDFPLDLRTGLILGRRTSGNRGKAHMRRLRWIFTYGFHQWQLIFLNLNRKWSFMHLSIHSFNSDTCDYLMGMWADVFFYANRGG